MQMRTGYNGALLARRVARVREREKETERESEREVLLIVYEPLHHLQAGRVAPCRWLLMRARCSLCLLCVPAGASRLTYYSLTTVAFVECVSVFTVKSRLVLSVLHFHIFCHSKSEQTWYFWLGLLSPSCRV